ncbi:MAG: hypothetical protein KBA06_02270 [Saprospiraceae bacterium]|nr:hypothetical protein [Saprospiraceae bacterium]
MKSNSAILFLFLLSLSSCELSLLNRDEIVKKEVEKNVSFFVNKRVTNCKQRALDSAALIVDSLLIKNALEARALDTLFRPPKPSKPNLPVIKTDSLDTIKVKPLF